MIYSPLEQFNILSVYDLTAASFSNYQVVAAQISILIFPIKFKNYSIADYALKSIFLLSLKKLTVSKSI